MAAVAWLIAHGGLYGLIAEALLAVSVAALFVWIWIRERRRARVEGPAEMREPGASDDSE